MPPLLLITCSVACQRFSLPHVLPPALPCSLSHALSFSHCKPLSFSPSSLPLSHIMCSQCPSMLFFLPPKLSYHRKYTQSCKKTNKVISKKTSHQIYTLDVSLNDNNPHIHHHRLRSVPVQTISSALMCAVHGLFTDVQTTTCIQVDIRNSPYTVLASKSISATVHTSYSQPVSPNQEYIMILSPN